MTKISIIVPVYNQETFLKRCINSLIAQTLKDIEIICVNDGSTDNSLNVLSEYSKMDIRIKVITQINSGVSEARNNGIKIATGEFIGFVDSDDFVDSDFYEKLYKAAISNNADIACSCLIRENDKKKKILIEYKKQKLAKTVKEKFELAFMPEHCYVCNKIFKRKSLFESGVIFKRGAFYEDMIYSPDSVEALGNMIAVADVWYHYWNNNNSIVKNSSDKHRADKLVARKHILNICNKYNINFSKYNNLICKREYYLLGIKILKIYIFKATKIYYLFGLIHILTQKDYI